MKKRDKIPQLPRGFSFSSAACGLKRTGLDLALLVSEQPASTAAVFTKNLVCAAPVQISREHLKKSGGRMKAIIVNSGNANCATGNSGIVACRRTAAAVAQELGCLPKDMLVCSTGVIGVPLRVENIIKNARALVYSRDSKRQSFGNFARAIMTTDTLPKWASAEFRVRGASVRIVGCAKGAGMIQPNMATMLAFLATDANIAPPLLQQIFRTAIGPTFNSITVDGDTSTNDTVAILANGASECPQIRAGTREFNQFRAAVRSICQRLAYAIVDDGEGARRVIAIRVRRSRTAREAEKIARTIANSALVKTAMAGADPNWGRILAAAGRAGVHFDPDKISLRVAGIKMYHMGRECPFNEGMAHRQLSVPYIPIDLDLHSGLAKSCIVTCDLTKEYVEINASYRS